MSRRGLRRTVRDAVVGLARTIGMKIIDPDTGESLGRAFVIPWRGKIHFIGLERPVRPFFIPQRRLTYWKQELGFTTHPPPDFPNVLRATHEAGAAERVLSAGAITPAGGSECDMRERDA